MSIFGRMLQGANLIDEPSAWSPIIHHPNQGFRSASGEPVTPDRALSLSTYFACLNVVSGDIAKMGVRLIDSRTKQQSQLLNVLSDPHPFISRSAWTQLLTHWAMAWGLGCAEIQRDASGQPRFLHPIHPSRVHPRRNDDGQLVYRVYDDPDVSRGRMSAVDFAPEDLFLIYGMGPDGFKGYSVAHYGAQTIGLSIAADQFAAGYYRNGGGINLAITMQKSLSPEARSAFRDSWISRHSGSRNSGKPVLLENGMSIDRFDVPANEAQMLESRQFQIEEICRWFRVPPVKVGHNQNVPFANIEAINRQHVNEALMPWVKKLEEEGERKLLVTPQQRNRLEFRYNVSELLRGDTAARASYYRGLHALGAMSPDDIREAEDLPAIGSEASRAYYMQSAMATIDQVFEGHQSPSARQPNGEPGRPRREEASQILRPLVASALCTVANKGRKAMENKGKLKESDPSAYSEWLTSFLDSQVLYLSQLLMPAAASVSHIGCISPRLEEIANCGMSQYMDDPDDSEKLTNYLTEGIEE